MRYFIQISYKGNNYKGWQKQKNTDGCIQDLIEMAITKATGVKGVFIVGCGRTDAGVHASRYFAHIDWIDETLPTYQYAINFNLPNDIVVHKIVEVASFTHARYDAIKRTYEYRMHFYLDPFLDELSAYYSDKELDVNAMEKACSIISTKTDFVNFCKTPLRNKNTNCYVEDCHLTYNEDRSQIKFYITANRFLRSMIRVLVGEILEVGRGRLSLEDLEQLFSKPRLKHISRIAHPQGLYLIDVQYESMIGD